MLKEVVRGYPGNCELQLLMCLDDGSRVLVSSRQIKVDVTPELRSRLDNLLGPGNVRLITDKGASGKPAAPPRGGNRSHSAAG